MLIRFNCTTFNVNTFLIFVAFGGVVLALTLPFQFFRPDIALLAELFAETRIERDEAFVEIALRFSPWFVAIVFFCIGCYLAIERTNVRHVGR